MPAAWQIAAAKTHAAIRAYYFNSGGTDEGWEKIRMNPKLFNTVWRRMINASPLKRYR